MWDGVSAKERPNVYAGVGDRAVAKDSRIENVTFG